VSGTTLPRLTDAERESLAVLAEEMGESLQDIGKMLRHGKLAVDRSVSPPVEYNNLRRLTSELGQVVAAVLIYQHVFRIVPGVLEAETRMKLRRVGQRLNSIDVGGLTAWLTHRNLM
jgi:NTP pyrophosphatase (non-canonical NTP hydrolase)